MQPKPDPDVLAAKMRRRFERAFPIDAMPRKADQLSWKTWLLLVAILAGLVWLV